MLSSMAVPINGFSLNLQKPHLITVLRSRVVYGAAESLSFTRLFKPFSNRIRVRSFQKEDGSEDEKPTVDEMLKSESTEKKGVSFIAKLGIGLGLALTITVICVTLKGSAASGGGAPFEVKSLAKASSSSSSVGFTFNAFGNRFVIPANAPGWVYFWLLMAAGFGLFISEEALNIWVGITLARMLTLDGTWQSFAESFSRNAPYIMSTVSWVYWGVCISDMIPFYLGKLFRESGASDDVCSKMGIGKEKAMSITQAVQKYGNLSGFVERFSLGVRNPTAFFAGALGISPECFFAGVCCGGLITLPIQLVIGFLLRERPMFAIATVATVVGIWTIFPYMVAAATALYLYIRSRYSPKT
ncbi:Transmembrane protein [Hirschfeldia incana]|nr:Transmembrane protein [Hirschfeldia incana]